ncbi:DUF4097 family beta strand repeat-containing protein [uncultured Anaerococcus sp.]|uniref:DUF4097 family beta strand repeat-containing protein n=1 Tax=uncultured Anaerococcus sp. TaxID=293428 RepID=UPI00288B1B06|nr:DUF4097 family beta strand repeat-containing protein [uncultured Anaerococcus sp.]
MDDKKIKIDEELIEDKNENKEQEIPKKINPLKLLENINKKYLIFGIIGVILLFLIIFKISSKKNASIQNSATTSQIDENSYNQSRIMRVDLNKIKSIDFDLGSSDVRIQRSNTNPYIEYTELFRGEDHSYKLDVSFEDGVLKLKSKVTGKQLYMKDKIPIVRIFLPSEGGIEEIKGTISAGDVKIDDLEVKNFDLKIMSGNISLNNGFFQGSIRNESGSINLDKSEISNTKLSTVTGDIIVKDSKLGNRLDFSTSTGDILIGAKDTIDNYNINAVLEVGNFVLGNISYRNIKDGYLSDNKARNNIDLRTKIGDIVFNRGEGAKIENEEYLTKDSKIKNDEDNALEKNIDRTEKENKKRKKKKRKKDSGKKRQAEENLESEENNDLEKNRDSEENSKEEENN